MRRRVIVLLFLALPLFAQDFKKQVIYQIVTDRFFNGNAANDDPAQSAGLFDAAHANWRLYWGGDLAGIQQKMPYLQSMGITAIWISPPVDNLNRNIPGSGGMPQAPYHGYAARDFKRIEEHFGDGGNSWAAFDAMVAAAHAAGIKVIVDFAPNHTNDNNGGEVGSVFDAGTFVAAYDNDPNGWFHHNPNITDWNDRYQLQYHTLFNLSELNQEQAAVDGYLKSALKLLASHGTDAFRIDAAKHVTWGWEYSMNDAIYTNAPSFVFGEWYQGNTSDPLYRDSYKFANRSGMSLLDFPLNTAIRGVFAGGGSFNDVDGALNTENANFIWANDLVTFVDNHDMPRLLSVYNNANRLNEALALNLTARGIPCIYYGDEQYLHDDTTGGGDPYNRPMMSSFSTMTTAYNLIRKLSALRQQNPALAYGTTQQRWMNGDVYIFERKFFNDVVLTAINRNDATAYNVSGLATALPNGNYADYLNGLMGGASITASGGSVPAFNLPAHSVSVWHSIASATSPQVGSIGPTIGQPGLTVTIGGKGFGPAAGSIVFNTTAATITKWSDTSVTFKVPSVAGAVYQVQLKNSGGTAANAIQFTVLTARLIPVTFTVNNATPTNIGDFIFLTGNTVELGNWTTTWDAALGPMLSPHYPNWFLNTSMPAGTAIQFKFFKLAANGTVTWEAGPNHTYTVPASGTGAVNVDWQY